MSEKINYSPFLGSEINTISASEAFFHILPVPYEKTVSYGNNTRLGPSAILNASWQLETWDGNSNPSSLGIYTHPAIDCQAEPSHVINSIAQSVASIIHLNGFPVVLGGEHTVSLGVIQGFMDTRSNPVGIVQFDAHADLRDSYLGERYSHASVMKRIVDMDIPLFQVGTRAYCEEEILLRKEKGIPFLDAEHLVTKQIMEIQLPDEFPEHIFVSIDVDGLDPSIFPSTGTPVPGGLGWYQTLSLLESISRQRKVIGFDLMEFSPINGFHCYDFSAALLIYKIMGIIQRQQD